eukprot:scaffold420650_cov15-Prasinocladus_malaysianus.AAC.1
MDLKDWKPPIHPEMPIAKFRTVLLSALQLRRAPPPLMLPVATCHGYRAKSRRRHLASCSAYSYENVRVR